MPILVLASLQLLGRKGASGLVHLHLEAASAAPVALNNRNFSECGRLGGRTQSGSDEDPLPYSRLLTVLTWSGEDTSSKAPLPNTIPLGVRVST